MLVPVKVPWRTQPPKGTRLNWDHPAMRHCIFIRNGDDKRDLITGIRPLNAAETGDSLADRRIKGRLRGIDYQSSNTYVDVYPASSELTSKFDGISECSVMCVFNADSLSTTTDEQRFVLMPNTNGAFNGSNFFIDVKQPVGESHWAIAGFIGADPGYAEINTYEVLVNKQYSLGGRFESGAVQWVHLWAPDIGHLNDTSSVSPSGSFASGKILEVGGRIDAGNDDTDGVIGFVAAFDRFLPRPMFESIMENPWQLFEPRTVWLPFEVSAAVVNAIAAGRFAARAFDTTSKTSSGDANASAAVRGFDITSKTSSGDVNASAAVRGFDVGAKEAAATAVGRDEIRGLADMSKEANSVGTGRFELRSLLDYTSGIIQTFNAAIIGRLELKGTQIAEKATLSVGRTAMELRASVVGTLIQTFNAAIRASTSIRMFAATSIEKNAAIRAGMYLRAYDATTKTLDFRTIAKLQPRSFVDLRKSVDSVVFTHFPVRGTVERVLGEIGTIARVVNLDATFDTSVSANAVFDPDKPLESLFDPSLTVPAKGDPL